MSYLRAPKLGEVLTARAELLHLGRRTASVTARVEDAAGRLLAHGTVTLLVLDSPASEDAGPAAAPRRRRAPAKSRGRAPRRR